MITVNGLTKHYHEVTALNGIDFEIPQGQTFGLLGPNGAGKTTAINILCGLVAADSGTVCLAGQTDPTRPEVRQILGLAPQSLALYEELSAQKNLTFFAKLYGFSGKVLTKRVDYCLEVAQLTERRNHRVSTFSGGMKRRLNLACALLHEPKILLLDEPTSSLDLRNQLEVMALIRRIVHTQALSAIIAIHDLNIAVRFADSFLFLKDQKVHATATRETLTAETIRQVYGVQVALKQFEGHTVVVPTGR